MSYSQFLSESNAARFLDIALRDLRALRLLGRGPKNLLFPNGKIRYRLDDLGKWGEQGGPEYVVEGLNVLAFPGVKVRIRRERLDNVPPLKPKRKRRQSGKRRRTKTERTMVEVRNGKMRIWEEDE